MRLTMEYSEIRSKRIKYNVSQNKLAKYSGYTPYTISAWELGRKNPNKSELEQLNNILDKLIYEIEKNNFNINKKVFQTYDSGEKKNSPKAIKNLNEYKTSLNNMQYNSEYSRELSDLYNKMMIKKGEEAPKAIALFSGCGGLDSGFEAAGFNIVGHVEIEESANKIYSSNFPNSKLLGKDICTLKNADIKGWKKEFGDIDIIIGGPPCQGFSLAGKRNPNDERNKLYKYYANIVSIIKPKIFVIENVNVMTSMRDNNRSTIYG